MNESPRLSELDDNGQCVQCGLCLPHCPTHRASKNEAESPRGRLMLMRALVERRLEPTPTLAARLDHCLHCGACTAMCPAKVPYDRLIDAAKHYLRVDAGRIRALPFWLRALTRARRARTVGAWLLTVAQRIGLLRSRMVRRVADTVAPNASPDMLPALKFRHCLPLTRRRAKDAGAPALFVGCIAQIADRETLHAGARLLQAAGCGVTVPPGQTCCGALHAHNGDAAEARAFVAHNRGAFQHAGAVVSCASGCGDFLRAQLAQPVLDFGEYFEARLCEGRDGAPRLEFEPLPRRVALHTPCTLRASGDKTAALLQRIPGAQLNILPSQGRCCGAAGANMLNHPETADALGRELLAHVADGEPLVTSNIGCAMHFRRIIKAEGKNTAVLHPATLLWRQLKRNKR